MVLRSKQEGGDEVISSDVLKVILGVLGGAIAVLLLIGGFSGGGMGGMGSMMSGGIIGGGIFGMLLFWVLVVALIVALVVWIVNQAQRR